MAHLLLEDKLGTSWAIMLQDEIKKEYFRKIPSILQKERQIYTVYPKGEDVFNAYKYTPYDQVKVVILGQSPYHNEGEAHGLAFSVPDECLYSPPSLNNIFKEIEDDLDIFHLGWSTNLISWAKQGVFLLNTILTTRKGEDTAHKDIGWKQFTQRTIELLNISPQPIVFMLWGNYAKGYKKYIDGDHHCILEAVHPSPLSAYRGGWFGNKHFSKCNEFLSSVNLQPINWITTI